MKITAVMPISREEFLDKVLESLGDQTIKPDKLVAIVDGAADFVAVRNKLSGIDYMEVLCVSSGFKQVEDIGSRRRRIADLHNIIKPLIGGCDWVFSIEDDGVLDKRALEYMVNLSKKVENPGLISGVELGRWGIKYVGLWKVDDVFEPACLESLPNLYGGDLHEEIDGSGLFCALIKPVVYTQHHFTSSNGLGPDVNLGLFSRQLGYKNYAAWAAGVEHLYKLGDLTVGIRPNEGCRMVTIRKVETNFGRDSEWRWQST